MDLIREQNRIRAKRYYDKHRQLISERRKAKRNDEEPPKKETIIEEPYSKAVINKLNDQIATIQQEIDIIKNKSNTNEKVTLPDKFNYSLDEIIQIISDNIKNEDSKKHILTLLRIYMIF